MSQHIYLANDLFSEANRHYNEHVASTIEDTFEENVVMYVPQRNLGINDKDAYADSQMILKADYEALKETDILVAILDSNDVGVALEIGMAYMLEIPIIGLFTDVRQQGTDNPKKVEAIKTIGENQFIYLNLMLSGAVKERGALVSTVEDLIQELDHYVVR